MSVWRIKMEKKKPIKRRADEDSDTFRKLANYLISNDIDPRTDCVRCKNPNWIMVGHSCGKKD